VSELHDSLKLRWWTRSSLAADAEYRNRDVDRDREVVEGLLTIGGQSERKPSVFDSKSADTAGRRGQRICLYERERR
jgi:hypothetical protein